MSALHAGPIGSGLPLRDEPKQPVGHQCSFGIMLGLGIEPRLPLLPLTHSLRKISFKKSSWYYYDMILCLCFAVQ